MILGSDIGWCYGMLNTDIFQFEFVDRADERQKVDEYLADFSKSPGYALWLNGKRGTGKSFFLTKYVVAKEEFTSIYVNVEIGNVAPEAYLKAFISQINKAADLKFISYLRANYSSILEIGQKAVNIALNAANLDDIGLNDLGASITSYFVSKHGEKENTVTVIKKYIAEAQKKCKKLVFLLDNFGQCDTASLNVIIPVIHELLCNAHIRFFLCTTDEDLENRLDIKQTLAEKIPNRPLIIHAFQQKQLFARMLEHSFDLDETNIKLLVQAFELCQGIPQQFKIILINLYTKQGIEVGKERARFIPEVFKNMLLKGEMSIDIDALCKEHKNAKVILQTIAFWGAPVPMKILYDFLDFYVENGIPILREETKRTLQDLEQRHILSYTFEDFLPQYQFEHDSLTLAVREYFRNDPSVSFLHFNIYEYLMQHKNEQEQPYWRNHYQSLLTYHAYASQADGWIDCNFLYGKSFFDESRYEEALSILSRLNSSSASLSGEQLLIMAITLYHCGHYQQADELLSIIRTKNLMRNFSPDQLILLYIFQARSRSCLLDSTQALEAIQQAEDLNITDPRHYVALMGAKQSILFLAPGHYQEAKDLFDSLVKESLEIREMALVYQSAMDYYEGDISLEYLDKGLSLAHEFSDFITQGKIINNMGFEYLRCGNYSRAKQHFDDSIAILKEHQSHELVYPYSNLAVLQMISGEWEKALDNIVEALFWNKSEYASLVLKTNRMLCYFFLENSQWEKLFHELYDYIATEHFVDDKIYKKICINMALLALKSKRSDQALKLLDYCRPHMEGEMSHGWYRFLYLEQKITGKILPLPEPRETRFFPYYCRIEFEPWLVNFSHD